MASRKERICEGCSAVEFTFSRVAKCDKCYNTEKPQKSITKELKQLLDWGYQAAEYTHDNEHGKRSYKVITPCCEHECNMLFGNINAMYKKYGKPPCPSCGGKERATKATAGYIAKYGRDYDISLMEDYAQKVRYETEQTYRKYADIINPNNYLRSTNITEDAYQIDHKMSIRDCFVHSIPIELAGSILNLTFLPALENTAKGRKSTLDLRKWIDKDLTRFDPRYLTSLTDSEPITLDDPINPAEHIQHYLDSVVDGLTQAGLRRKLKTSNTEIETLLEYGYTGVQLVDTYLRGHYEQTVNQYSVTHDGRTEVVDYNHLKILMKNGFFLWPVDTTYKKFIKENAIMKSRNRVVTDEERERKSKAHRGYKFPDGVKQTLAAKAKGRKRWYHPDYPSFKQSKECPGEGWTVERLTK